MHQHCSHNADISLESCSHTAYLLFGQVSTSSALVQFCQEQSFYSTQHALLLLWTLQTSLSSTALVISCHGGRFQDEGRDRQLPTKSASSLSNTWHLMTISLISVKHGSQRFPCFDFASLCYNISRFYNNNLSA